MYASGSPGYPPALFMMRQSWPQTSTSAASEGTYDLPVDAGTESRTFQASSASFRYTGGTPYKVAPTQSNGAPPPYSPSPNPYQTAMYPIRSAYPQQNLYAQQGAYYTQPVYAAQPHVIHHTTVVQPNSIQPAIYPTSVPAPRTNGMAMGMVAGTTMAMTAAQHLALMPTCSSLACWNVPVQPNTNWRSSNSSSDSTCCNPKDSTLNSANLDWTLLTTPQHTQLGPHPVSVPTYRTQGTPAYSYVPPHW
ncbi:protein FAM168A isoform X3 [Scyliorhinus canicula]|nr:protein FAM168A isoform X3 [Scyliorhinus canicula]